jgi:hypothetical protein
VPVFRGNPIGQFFQSILARHWNNLKPAILDHELHRVAIRKPQFIQNGSWNPDG